MVSALSPAYISLVNSFRDECKDLIAKFKELKSDSFSSFAKLFRSSKFNLIYEKYGDSLFYYDFKEDSLQVAKYLMLNEHFLGGLYLIYGLFHVQEDPKHCIRLEYNEFEKIMELIKEERHTLLETCQPGYVFAKLLKSEAFAFTYFARDYSMEGNSRARLIYSTQKFIFKGEEKPLNKTEWLGNFLEGLDFVKDLKRVDEEYFKTKRKLKDEHSELNLALDMLPDDTLGDLIKNIEESENPINDQDADIGARRRKLRNRTLNKKHSYRMSASFFKEYENKPSSSNRVTRGRGCPKGQRKLYFQSAVNSPKYDESGESSDYSSDDVKLDLPQID